MAEREQGSFLSFPVDSDEVVDGKLQIPEKGTDLFINKVKRGLEKGADLFIEGYGFNKK